MMTNISYKRQNGIINIKNFRQNEITIIGCGAIGSFVAISLAKMGLTNFILYDDDKVEEHNLPNQFFTTENICFWKTTATAYNMNLFNNECNIVNINKRFDKNCQTISPIVICCVDDINTRKKIFNQLLTQNQERKYLQLFIDTRMGGLQGEVYFVDVTNKDSINRYLDTLFPKSKASQLPCSERSIIFTVMGVASIVCNGIVQILKGQEYMERVIIDYKLPQII
jgi:molybdopterin/thiamine biosynthesis adenylyltransferase